MPFRLYEVLYHVPVLNLFRGPTRHLMEVHFALAVLAGRGLDGNQKQPETSVVPGDNYRGRGPSVNAPDGYLVATGGLSSRQRNSG